MDDQTVGLLVAVALVALYWYYSMPVTHIYRFYMPTCGYCVKSQPAWDAFKAACRSDVSIKPVDVLFNNKNDPNYHLVAKYKVDGVPAIWKVKHGVSTMYNGDRSTADIMRFAKM